MGGGKNRHRRRNGRMPWGIQGARRFFGIKRGAASPLAFTFMLIYPWGSVKQIIVFLNCC
jgi:hypothetical protein